MSSNCLKSPISRMGGKFYLRDFLVQHIPEHKVFVEVFTGSCIISLTKKPSETTIVNDLDSHLITFWKVLKDSGKRKQLIIVLEDMLFSRQVWQEIRSNWKSGIIPGDPVEASAQWFFLNRSSYASDIRCGGFIGYTQGRNMCKTFRNAIAQLNEAGERIKTWIIENLPFQECIRRFDSPETVFYCDMPYYLLGKRDYYSNSFTLDDHKALAGLLNNIKGKALVSHYKDDVISGLYSGWNCYEFESFKGLSNGSTKAKTQEILFCNFEPETRGLFK